MKSRESDPSLLRLTRALLHLLQGLANDKAEERTNERALLEYQMIALFHTTVQLHALSARISNVLERTVHRPQPSGRGEADERFEEPGRIAKLLKEQSGRLAGADASEFRMQLAECLDALHAFYSEDSLPPVSDPPPMSQPHIDLEHQPDKPASESAANMAPVLLIPKEIIRVKIGHQLFDKVIP